MIIKKLYIMVGIGAMALLSCGESTPATTDSKANAETSTTKDQKVGDKGASSHATSTTDNRFKFDGQLSNRHVKMILNTAAIPIGVMTDFYLKVEGVENINVTVSTNVAEGLVSKNKEPYYFGVKGVEGASEVRLKIQEQQGDERIVLGEIVVPTVK